MGVGQGQGDGQGWATAQANHLAQLANTTTLGHSSSLVYGAAQKQKTSLGEIATGAGSHSYSGEPTARSSCSYQVDDQQSSKSASACRVAFRQVVSYGVVGVTMCWWC